MPDAKRDRHLKHKLKAELPQILAWAIAGAVDVLKNGFSDPAAVLAANADYVGDHDTFGEWLNEKCLLGPKHEDRSISLFKSWNAYRKDRGDENERIQTFSERMKRRGYIKFKKSGMYWRGLTLNGPEIE